MLIDSQENFDMIVPHGTELPSNPDQGLLFFLATNKTLYVFEDTWVPIGESSVLQHSLSSSHLSKTERDLLSRVNVQADEINALSGVTSNVQEQLDKVTTHVNSNTLHLTTKQFNFLNNIDSSLLASDFSALSGVKSNIQQQIDAIALAGSTTRTAVAHISTTVVPAIEASIEDHKTDSLCHISLQQKALLSSAEQIGITTSDVQKLVGIGTITGTLKSAIEAVGKTSVQRDGSAPMTGSLDLGANRIKNVAAPKHPADAATKRYVDEMIVGLKWDDVVLVVCQNEKVPCGLDAVDGVKPSVSSRVLLVNQSNKDNNGIWLASSSEWTKVETSTKTAVHVLKGSSAGTSWVQSSNGFVVFDGSSRHSFGAGLTETGASVSISPGAGIAIKGSDVVADPDGLTIGFTNNQLSLTKTGVKVGIYGSSSTIPVLTIDAMGRVSSANAVDVSADWSNIRNKPTSASELGLQDVLTLSGNTTSNPITGEMMFSSGACINSTRLGAASFTSSRYGQFGDGRTHLGYNNNGTYLNYLRGSSTSIEGEMIIQYAADGIVKMKIVDDEIQLINMKTGNGVQIGSSIKQIVNNEVQSSSIDELKAMVATLIKRIETLENKS